MHKVNVHAATHIGSVFNIHDADFNVFTNVIVRIVALVTPHPQALRFIAAQKKGANERDAKRMM